MNARERILAIVLLTAILLGGGGLLGKVFLLDPLNDRSERIKYMQKQIGELKERRQQVLEDRAKLERWKQLSLPADANLARREYQKLISEMLRQSGFVEGASTVLAPKEANTKSSPTLPGRKEPIYTRLEFTVRGQAELASIAGFLNRFYQTPLLHEIKTINIQRPQTVTQAQRPNDLDVNLTIEALIIAGVDNRPQLLPNISKRVLLVDAVAAMQGGMAGLGMAGWAAGPAGPLGPEVLAEPSREYDAIASKNVFFGRRPVTPKVNVDVREFVYLTDITRTDLKLEAWLYDRYNGIKKRLRASAGFSDLKIKDSQGEMLIDGVVVRIDERDVIFRVGKKYYSLHVGQNLASALEKPLKEEQIKSLGLAAKKP